MLFSLLKHYLDTALKVSQSVYCFTTSISYGVENYFPRLWGTGISDAIFILVAEALAIKIRNAKIISGIMINKEEYKICQLADNATLFLKNIPSMMLLYF